MNFFELSGWVVRCSSSVCAELGASGRFVLTVVTVVFVEDAGTVLRGP